MSNWYIFKKRYSIFNVRGGNMLEMNMEFRKGILFIRLNGILNAATSKKLADQVNDFVQKKGIKYFTFNLEGLEEITQEGIDTIRENYHQIVSFQGNLVLCGVKSEGMRTVFEDVYQSSSELGVFQMLQI